MSIGFKWILEFVDKASKPARDAERATEGYEKELHKVEQQIERIKHNPVEFKKLQSAKKELRELSGGSKSFAERFEEMGKAIKRVGFVQDLQLGAEALKLAYEAGEKVIDVVVDIGSEMIHAAGASERFKIGFTSLLGDEQGGELLEYIERVSKVTEGTTDDMKALSARLVTIGFDAKELSQVLPASLDIAGFLGGGIGKANEAAEALAHIKTTGEISKRSLGALGLQWTQVMKELQKETGLSEEGVKDKLEKGKFGPQALHAVLQSIANKEGGTLGTTAEKMGSSLEARLTKLREVPEKIFEKWADSPGFTRFSSAVQKIVDKLDPNGPNGKKIFDSLDKASMKVVELVDKFASGDGIDKFAAAVSRVLDDVDRVPAILDKIVTVSEVIATIWAGSQIVGGFSTLASLLPGIGTAAGVATGAIGAMAAPLIAVAAAIGSVVFAVKEWHDVISSYREIKEYEKEQGITDEMKRKTDTQWKSELADLKAIRDAKRAEKGFAPIGATPESTAPPAPAIVSQSTRVQPAQSRSSQSLVIQPGAIAINAPSGNADEIAQSVNQSLPGAVQQSFERMAVSSGAM